MKRIILLFIVFPLLLVAQEEKVVNVSFSGHVKNDLFFDSRQVVVAREGLLLMYPADEKLDIYGNDINAKSTLNILAIHSRLAADISVQEFRGIKTSGLLDGDFYGVADTDVNGFRLRSAYAKINWKNTEFLFGQTEHAIFVTECYPTTVSYSSGVPFQPFARNPQIRFTQKYGKIKILIAAMSQRDFVSMGPDGMSSKYLRNSGIPDSYLRLEYNSKSEEKKKEILIGIGGGYKVLVPRLMTDSFYHTDEHVNSMSAIAFLKWKMKKLTFKTECVYGENMHDVLMIGGYAIKSNWIKNEAGSFSYVSDTSKTNYDYRDYTSLNNLSFWLDVHTNGEKLQGGFFAGYCKNLGSKENIYEWKNNNSYYSRGHDIAYLYRVAPRIILNLGKTRFAMEVEYTVAAYTKKVLTLYEQIRFERETSNYDKNKLLNAGNTLNSLGQVQEFKEVGNVRLLFTVYRFF